MRGRRVSDRRKLVDQVLEADKRLVGRGAWRPDGPHGKQRLLLPIEVEGELSGTELQIKSYPNAPSLRFRILLIVGKCVWRLDYVDDDNHINPANRPPETPAGPIREPHYHAWLDNKRFAKHNSLPDELKVASPDYSRDALDYGPSGWIRAAFALRAGGAPILTTIRRNAWCSAGLEHHRAGLMNNPG